jgi:hypothetical protein
MEIDVRTGDEKLAAFFFQAGISGRVFDRIGPVRPDFFALWQRVAKRSLGDIDFQGRCWNNACPFSLQGAWMARAWR